MSSDTALTVALVAGWLASVVLFTWPVPKCDYRARCPRCREWDEADNARKEWT